MGMGMDDCPNSQLKLLDEADIFWSFYGERIVLLFQECTDSASAEHLGERNGPEMFSEHTKVENIVLLFSTEEILLEKRPWLEHSILENCTM